MFLEIYVVAVTVAIGRTATLAGVASLAGITSLAGTSALRSSTALRSTSSLVGVILVVTLPGVCVWCLVDDAIIVKNAIGTCHYRTVGLHIAYIYRVAYAVVLHRCKSNVAGKHVSIPVCR